MLHSSALTHTNIRSFARQLKHAASEHFQVRESSLLEALSRGLGAQTYASLSARSVASVKPKVVNFDHAAVVARLTELADERSAEAVAAMLVGMRLVIQITKYSPARQRADRYADVAYEVVAEVHGADPTVLAGQPQFFVPDFTSLDGTENYRLDSASEFRVDTHPFAVTRRRLGNRLLTAKLIDGRWKGALYVYAGKDQQDNSRCLGSVKASLARRILSAVTPGVRCSIFQPDTYDYGAWRVEMMISPAIQDYWDHSPLRFALPDLSRRLFLTSKAESHYRPDVNIGRFVDGVWRSDVYSNGIPEDDNPTTIGQVRAALLASVNATVRRSGFSKREFGELEASSA